MKHFKLIKNLDKLQNDEASSKINRRKIQNEKLVTQRRLDGGGGVNRRTQGIYVVLKFSRKKKK